MDWPMSTLLFFKQSSGSLMLPARKEVEMPTRGEP
jgi:hypothetical protein